MIHMDKVLKMVDNKVKSEYYIDNLRFWDTVHEIRKMWRFGQAAKHGRQYIVPSFSRRCQIGFSVWIAPCMVRRVGEIDAVETRLPGSVAEGQTQRT